MKLKEYLIVLIVFILLMIIVSCKITSVEGNYFSETEVLKLYKNDTYEYFENLHLNRKTSTGTYKLSGDNIFLKSTFDIRNLSLKVTDDGFSSFDKDSITLSLVNTKDLGEKDILSYCLVIDDSIAINLGDRLLQQIKIQKPKKDFRVEILPNTALIINCNDTLTTEKILILGLNSSKITLTMSLGYDILSYISFNDSSWQINRWGRKIIWNKDHDVLKKK